MPVPAVLVSADSLDASVRDVVGMAGVDAWTALADEVVARGDPALQDATAEALQALGLTDIERQGIVAAIARRQDPAGLLLDSVASSARPANAAPTTPPDFADPGRMDAALALSRELTSAPAETVAQRLATADRETLADLPPDAAGSFVAALVGSALSLPDAARRKDALRAVLGATSRVTMARLPVADVLTRAVQAQATADELGTIALLLARVPSSRLVAGTLDALRGDVSPAEVVALLALVGRRRAEVAPVADAVPFPAPGEPVPAPVSQPVPAPAPAPPRAGTTARRAAAVVRDRLQRAATRWRGGGGGAATPSGAEPPPAGEPPAPPPPPAPAPPAEPPPASGAARYAYPRIDVDAHRELRPEVVVVDEPFDVTAGLAKYADARITQTGAMAFFAGTATVLELVLVYDPSSLVPQGDTRLTLAVTDADPYPSATVSFVAQYRPDLPVERRIGVHYLRDGQVVGIAWRTVVAVPYAKDVATAPTPAAETDTLLDLEPLLGADLPDLMLSICASDGAASGEFVWTAYAGASDVTVPDAPRVSTLDSDLQGFVTEIRQAVAFSQGRYGDYLTLAGKAKRMGRAIPEGIQAVLREVVEDPSRTSAATVLLLTEELLLPWELASLDPPLDTAWGGSSPFLGAHAAVSRWPLTEHKPRPTPRATVSVRSAAVLTADYTGVPGWGKLEYALAEAQQVAALFSPPAVAVRPSLREVVGMLRGSPAADVLHVALHGQFDAKGAQEGLVLLGTDASGQLTTKAHFLTPDQVENGRLDGGPFVFLNACQVASDKRVLGDYGGFASTLLRIGAAGVVAPLWNVDDDIAAAFARDFYAATWTATGDGGSPAPVSAAEAVRALRARYTEAAAEAETPGVTATLVAFQVFGHPRLRLHHS